MDPRRNDHELLLLVLAFLAAADGDDDGYLHHLLHRRLRRGRELSPELEEMFEYLTMRPRGRRRVRPEEAREIAAAVVDGYRGSVDGRLAELSESISRLRADVEQMEETAAERAERAMWVSADFHSFVWMASTGADFAEAKMIRFVPVRVFVANGEVSPSELDALAQALASLTGEFGLVPADDLPPQSGSWWKTLVLRTKRFFTQEEVRDVADKARVALELVYLDKPQAEANCLQAEGAAQVITALTAVEGPSAVQAGSLLVVKTDGPDGRPSIIARTLSPMELRRLEENRNMLGRPHDLLPWLATASDDSSDSTDLAPA